jgi:hypothetical protein
MTTLPHLTTIADPCLLYTQTHIYIFQTRGYRLKGGRVERQTRTILEREILIFFEYFEYFEQIIWIKLSG